MSPDSSPQPPARQSSVVHTQECEDEMFMFHAATGGDMDCTCGAVERWKADYCNHRCTGCTTYNCDSWRS